MAKDRGQFYIDLLEYIDWHAANVEDCTGRKPDLGWLRDRKRLRFHSLRHSCGAWLASKGVSERIIQEILGHESPTTTQIYSHVASSTVENAMERVFGS